MSRLIKAADREIIDRFEQAIHERPEDFVQMQWQMACTGRQWGDFVSYDPRMPRITAAESSVKSALEQRRRAA